MAVNKHFDTQLEVVLNRNDLLGRGAYGEVCRCWYGHLACAGKVLHAALFQSEDNDPGSSQILARFEEECSFISELKHPNIVQYLGLHYDHEFNAPVLLMELLDCNLTSFLSRHGGGQPLPQKIQLDICADVALALEFLHAHDILHQDLSSNNVLLQLAPNDVPICAKVTDFGVSKISDPNRFLVETQPCPGSLVYMAPEVLQMPPEYSAKLDIYSFGVLMIQIITTQFPNPTPFSICMVDNLTEVERRADDLAVISTDHPICPLIIDCLNNDRAERPNASKLCAQLCLIKETDFYVHDHKELMPQVIEEESSAYSKTFYQCLTCEQYEQEKSHFEAKLKHLLTEHSEAQLDYQKNYDNLTEQLRELLDQNSSLRQQNEELNEKFEQANKIIGDLRKCLDEQALEIENKHEKLEEAGNQIEKLEIALHDANQHSQSLHAEKANLIRTLSPPPPKESLPSKKQRSTSIGDLQQHRNLDSNSSSVCLQVEEPIDTIFAACMGAATSNVYKAFFMDRNGFIIFGYDGLKKDWFDLPPCPVTKCGLAIINGQLTTVGGEVAGGTTNVLYCLNDTSNCSEWIESLPPMPSKRSQPGITTTEKHLIVAGGSVAIWKPIPLVEIMDIKTFQWHEVASLPIPLCRSSICITHNQIHVLGGMDVSRKWQKRCFSCSMKDLTESQPSSQIWLTLVPDLPTEQSGIVSKSGLLFSIGGCMPHTNTIVSDIYIYNHSQRKWRKMDNTIHVGRSQCFIVSLPRNQLIIVGGRASSGIAQNAEFINVF